MWDSQHRDMRLLSRRQLLAGLGVVAASGAAGCLSTVESSRTRLAEIVFINMDDSPHTVALWIEAAGETVFQTVQDLPPADEIQPVLTHENGLPTEAASYTVRAEVDGGADSIERTYPDRSNGNCYGLTVRLNQDGTIRDLPSDGTADACVPQ